MIKLRKGHLLDSCAPILIVPVNCIGEAHTTLDLEMKVNYPYAFKFYRQKCQKGLMKPGSLLKVPSPDTKEIWYLATRNGDPVKSNLEFVNRCLSTLHHELSLEKGLWISVPVLGEQLPTKTTRQAMIDKLCGIYDNTIEVVSL